MIDQNHNPYSRPEENHAHLLQRLNIYQKERFPLLGHGVLVTAFSFSAISYSRISRGAEGFVSLDKFLVAIFTTVTLFLLVRILDEFKDAEDDEKYRRELPVPRGVVSFSELRTLGILVAVTQIIINGLFFPRMLLMYGGVVLYLALMTKEFFIADWLKKHQFWYVTSHMFIIPFIDVYASGFDWFLAGVSAPFGLLFFFAVSYMNGIVLEVGRKIKAPEEEAEGVLTYSVMLGKNKAVGLWTAVLLLTLGFSFAAAYYAGYDWIIYGILTLLFLLCFSSGMLFLTKPVPKRAKLVETGSALWTVGMYLCLGAGPMISRYITEL